jgi:hypothetical protein
VYSLPKLLRSFVHSTALPHYADFMNLHVPPELEAKLDRLAAATEVVSRINQRYGG